MSAQAVPLRKLGKNGPSVPALGFGLMGMSFAYGTILSDEERFKVLDRAVELGATFWDTADLYGDSEELIGKWFQRTGKRDDIFIATKFGFLKGTGFRGFDSSAAYCKQACEKSLELLGIDYIDLYYLHRPNADTPIEETMRALSELKAEGKIRNIGLSNVTSNTLRRAYKISPIAAVQTEYSPFDLDIESAKDTNLLATCRELGVTVVCYAPLGRGLLTTKFGSGEYGADMGDLRPASLPRFKEENRAANMKLVNQFKELADKKKCTTAQLSLAWLLKQGEDIIPNPGTKTIKYLEENWGALNVHLTDEDELEIRNFVERAEVAGGRAPEGITPLVDTNEET